MSPAIARPSPSRIPFDSRMRVRAMWPQTIGAIGMPISPVTSEAIASPSVSRIEGRGACCAYTPQRTPSHQRVAPFEAGSGYQPGGCDSVGLKVVDQPFAVGVDQVEAPVDPAVGLGGHCGHVAGHGDRLYVDLDVALVIPVARAASGIAVEDLGREQLGAHTHPFAVLPGVLELVDRARDL